MGHADEPLAVLVDHGHTGYPRVVVWEALAHEVEEACVDLVDDLKMTRKQRGEHGQGPPHQRFRQNGVIGVVDGLRRYLPGLVPVEAVDVHQQTHQLCDADGGMGVVELDRGPFVKDFDGGTVVEMPPDHVLEGARGEKVLLLKTKLFAAHLFVVGIEDLGDIFGKDFGIHRTLVVAAVKSPEEERLCGLGSPEAKGVCDAGAISEDRRVVWDSLDDCIGNPLHFIYAEGVGPGVGVAAITYLDAGLRTPDLPWIAVAEPMVGEFNLPAIVNLLVKHAELVANAVTHGRNSKRGERIKITGSETT